MWSLNKTSVSILSEDLTSFITDKKLSSNYNPSFQFDSCFSWDSTNSEIYNKVAKNLVLSAFEGYNSTIFAYGQTGSGKTYTMLGKREEVSVLSCRNPNLEYSDRFSLKSEPSKSSEEGGLIILALEDIFASAINTSDRRFYFSCSYMEIYNEHVYDLLKGPEEFTTESLGVIEGPDKEFIVRGLSEQVVTSIEEVLERLYKGEQNRHYAATNLNHHSSRSHTIFKLNVKSLRIIPKVKKNEDDDNFENVTTESSINFVDLAGSEKVNTIQAAAETEKIRHQQFSVMSNKSDMDKIISEGKNINTSLFYLCQVINKLSEKKLGIIKSDSHVPFRNSNLTKILRSSLAGNARTCIICTATAVRSQFEQTLSTLRFGNSARSITNKVRANIRTETNTQLLLTYEQDIASLKKEVELTYQRGKAYSNESLLVRQQLELKIQTLCKKILKKNSINIIRSVKNKTFRGLWNKTSGELFTCFDQETENKQILWDEENFTEKALTVLRDLQTADREKKNLFISISNLTNSTNCLLMANQSLTKEREKYLDVIEKVREEITSSEIELNEVQKNLKIVQKKVEVFQSGTGIESLNSKELADFESTLINRIKDIRAEKAKRRFQQEFEVIKRKLETYVDSEVLDDLEC
jgi:hypothetical protein